MTYTNPFEDYNPIFTYYKSSEPIVTSVEDPLFGKLNIEEGFRINPQTGNYIAKANTPKSEEFQTDYLNKMAGTHSEQTTPSEQIISSEELPPPPTIKKTKQSLSGDYKKAMEFFMSKGLLHHQAAGLVGNLMRESRMDPTAKNKYSGAYGIAQWLGDRKTNLFNKYGSKPTFEQQLEFAWWELNNTHKKGLEALKRSKSVDEAAANAFGWFEFQVGPKGAIAEMNKYKQDGLGAYNAGIQFARKIAGNG